MFKKDYEVHSVFFKVSVMVPGIINSESSITSDKYPGIKMYIDGDWLHIDYKGKSIVINGSYVSSALMKEYHHKDDKVVPIKK